MRWLIMLGLLFATNLAWGQMAAEEPPRPAVRLADGVVPMPDLKPSVWEQVKTYVTTHPTVFVPLILFVLALLKGDSDAWFVAIAIGALVLVIWAWPWIKTINPNVLAVVGTLVALLAAGGLYLVQSVSPRAFAGTEILAGLIAIFQGLKKAGTESGEWLVIPIGLYGLVEGLKGWIDANRTKA